MTKSSAVYVRTPDQVPTVEHWAIIKGSHYQIEASGQWAPGHGYAASTEEFIEYIAYLDKVEFEVDFIRASTDRRHKIRAIHVLPMTATTTVKLE